MKYALQSSVHVDSIEARSFHCSSGGAILSFRSGTLTGTLSLHVPPSVADATADAFNEAMAEYEREQEMARMKALYDGEKAAGLHRSEEELAAELRDAGRGHLVRP